MLVVPIQLLSQVEFCDGSTYLRNKIPRVASGALSLRARVFGVLASAGVMNPTHRDSAAVTSKVVAWSADRRRTTPDVSCSEARPVSTGTGSTSTGGQSRRQVSRRTVTVSEGVRVLSVQVQVVTVTNLNAP